MDALTAFGLLAVTLMLVAYALESRSHWWILVFALACLLGSTYGFLQGAWPFGVVEAVWAVVATARWWKRWTHRHDHHRRRQHRRKPDTDASMT